MSAQKRIANELTVAEAVKLKNAAFEHFKGTDFVIDWKQGLVLHAQRRAVIGYIGVAAGRPYVSDERGDNSVLILSLSRD